jgi:hypothetical protein
VSKEKERGNYEERSENVMLENEIIIFGIVQGQSIIQRIMQN